MQSEKENLSEAHHERSPAVGMAKISVRSDFADLDCVALIEDQPTMTLEAFVDRFGDCEVTARSRVPGVCYDDRLRSVRQFYAEARTGAGAWGPDEDTSPYLFHDNLTRKGSYVELRELFDEHQPPDDVIDLSERLPCGGMLVTLGGPDSSTGMHSHGPAYCMLLAGVKEWWIWRQDADPMLRWITHGAVATNYLAYWETHVQPALDDGVCILERLDALQRSGLFRPPAPSHRSTEVIARMRAGDEPIPTASRLRPLRIQQRAGQGIYIPERCGHAVRNLDWHLALIYQFEPAGEHY
jgi:hypothetical protein